MVMVFNATFSNISVISWRSVFSTNKTDLHDITEILLKVALNTITIFYFGSFHLSYILFMNLKKDWIIELMVIKLTNPKLSNQNKVFIWCTLLIGCFFQVWVQTHVKRFYYHKTRTSLYLSSPDSWQIETMEK